MFRWINAFLRRMNAAIITALLLVVATAFSAAVAVGVDAAMFDGDLTETLVTALLTTPLVSLPLVVLSVVTIKNLDRSKDRYRRLRDRALAESQAKSGFLANTSHELRTPLNAILGFSQMLEREPLGPLGSPKYKEYVADIRASGEHLLAVIDDLLALARDDAGTVSLCEEEIDIGAALEMPLRMVEERASRGGIALRLERPEELPMLRADPRLVRQMVINLLSNAIKFTPEGGTVTVAAGLDADRALYIAVRDTGIGMSAEHMVIALEPFGQVEAVDTRHHGGLGLGLPLVKSMIELHGGRLDLSSRLGAGTEAVLRFPPQRLGLRRVDAA